MGNEISSFCGCSSNQNKGIEQNIVIYYNYLIKLKSDYAIHQNRIKNNFKIHKAEENNKEDLFMSNLEKNRAKNFNEKSTNLSDNDDRNVSSKSNQGKFHIYLFRRIYQILNCQN